MDEKTIWQKLYDPYYYWMPSNEERLNYLDHPETHMISQGNFKYRINHRLKDENEDQTENS